MACNLCPNGCNIDRNIKTGFCGTGNKIRIAKFYAHAFEEPFISGKNGSGTVFFCGCSLKCAFCQNFEVSRNLTGKEISEKELADIFKTLEESGVHNINLVNPTHFSAQIVSALKIYRPNIPIVYNTHGYENVEILKEIDPYIDVYLPDLKFFSPAVSERYSKKADYFIKASKAIEFMAEKPLAFLKDGMLKSGTVVRHLVLPQNTSDSKAVIKWYAENLKDKCYINIMSQYTPFGDIKDLPELQRKLSKREYDGVLDYAISLGIENMFYQKMKSADTVYIPKWDF